MHTIRVNWSQRQRWVDLTLISAVREMSWLVLIKLYHPAEHKTRNHNVNSRVTSPLFLWPLHVTAIFFYGVNIMIPGYFQSITGISFLVNDKNTLYRIRLLLRCYTNPLLIITWEIDRESLISKVACHFYRLEIVWWSPSSLPQ